MLVQFQGPLNKCMTKESKTQLSSIDTLTIHQASRDTCRLANKYQFVCSISWQLSSSELDNFYELADKCLMDDNCVLEFI